MTHKRSRHRQHYCYCYYLSRWINENNGAKRRRHSLLLQVFKEKMVKKRTRKNQKPAKLNSLFAFIMLLILLSNPISHFSQWVNESEREKGKNEKLLFLGSFLLMRCIIIIVMCTCFLLLVLLFCKFFVLNSITPFYILLFH